MRKVLVAVDDTKGSKAAVNLFAHVCKCVNPEAVVLVHVEKLEGRSLIDEMLGDPEMSTLKQMLEGTEYKAALDRRARRILDFYKKVLEENGIRNIVEVVRAGHPADEILAVATKEEADMIIVGSRGNRTSHLFMGSVSREIADRSEVPVILVKIKPSN